MADEPTTLSRLYRVRRTVMQMLRDRGYLVLDFEISMSKNEFNQKFGDNFKREDLVINKAMKNDPNDQIYVFFPNEEKVGMKQIKKCVELMEKEKVPRAILVVEQNLTPFAKAHIQELTPKYHLEVFQEAELMINIKEHVLIPEHQVLTNEEKKDFVGAVYSKRNPAPTDSNHRPDHEILRPEARTGCEDHPT